MQLVLLFGVIPLIGGIMVGHIFVKGFVYGLISLWIVEFLILLKLFIQGDVSVWGMCGLTLCFVSISSFTYLVSAVFFFSDQSDSR